MLAIPRPRTRAECPPSKPFCPFVGCRHHLLLEVEASTARPPKLKLNARAPGRNGRPPGLPYSAAEVVVQGWIDDALELLETMPHTCSLDAAEALADGEQAFVDSDEVFGRAVGAVLGVSKQQVLGDVEAAQASARAEAERRDLDTRIELRPEGRRAVSVRRGGHE